MAAPRESVQGIQIGNGPRSKRVQVNIADQFQEVGLFLDHYGLVPILKEVPPPSVAAIEFPRIARKEDAHVSRQGSRSGAHEEMEMVRKERPRIHAKAACLNQTRQAIDEIGPIPIVSEDGLPIQSATHHVLEDPGGVKARLTRHGRNLYSR